MPLPVSTLPTIRFGGSGGPRPALGLVHVAHAHAFGDVFAQSLVGGGGVGGHTVILAGCERGATCKGRPTKDPHVSAKSS